MSDVVKYSEAFKMQVVREIEDGVHPNCFSAGKAYDIRGACTVNGWVRKYGREHLLKRVVRVESKGEQSELKALRARVKKLESALSDAHLDILLERAYTEIACELSGIEDMDAFKKKADMELCARRHLALKKKG